MLLVRVGDWFLLAAFFDALDVTSEFVCWLKVAWLVRP